MDIKHVAALANLKLTPAEELLFSSQLNQVVDYVSQLQQIDTSQVSPTSQSIDLKNVTHPDNSGSVCLSLDSDYFKVPAIFDNE